MNLKANNTFIPGNLVTLPTVEIDSMSRGDWEGSIRAKPHVAPLRVERSAFCICMVNTCRLWKGKITKEYNLILEGSSTKLLTIKFLC